MHDAAAGKNGPVVFVLEANAKLTGAQVASFNAGNLYVNVHSAAHADGEIRGQLKP